MGKEIATSAWDVFQVSWPYLEVFFFKWFLVRHTQRKGKVESNPLVSEEPDTILPSLHLWFCFMLLCLSLFSASCYRPNGFLNFPVLWEMTFLRRRLWLWKLHLFDLRPCFTQPPPAPTTREKSKILPPKSRPSIVPVNSDFTLYRWRITYLSLIHIWRCRRRLRCRSRWSPYH